MDILNRDEDELAVVVAHECAHVVARHSAERLGLRLFLQIATAALTYYILTRNSNNNQRCDTQLHGA